MILVSACLLGINCRFDGGNCADRNALAALRRGKMLIPVCPEQLGGLPTPRPPCHIESGDGESVLTGSARVIDVSGTDVTAAFLRGADEVRRIAAMCGSRTALLRESSPSCGVLYIKRHNRVVHGRGVTAALLAMHGIRLISSDYLTQPGQADLFGPSEDTE